MAKKRNARDEQRPPKTEEELNILRDAYELVEPLGISPLPNPDDIGDEKPMKPIIVHYARKGKRYEK